MPRSVRRSLVLVGALVAVLTAALGLGRAVEGASRAARHPGAVGPDAATIEATRSGLLRLLEWPGTVNLTLENAELLGGADTVRLDVTGEKTATGLTLRATLTPPGGAAALEVQARVRSEAEGAVRFTLNLAGEPRRLAGLWPSTLPSLTALAANTDVRLLRGGVITSEGRVTLGGPDEGPTGLDFTARYDGNAGDLVLPRWVAAYGSDLRLEGEARAALWSESTPVTATARGDVDGGRVEARGRYLLGSGAYDGTLVLAPFDARRLAQRFGLAPLPEVNARRITVRFDGTATGSAPSVRVDARADGLRLAALAGVDLHATARGSLKLARTAEGLGLASVESTTLTLGEGEQPLLTLRGASRSGGAWPVDVTGGVDDLGRLTALLPFKATLGGAATVAAELRRLAPLALLGRVDLTLPRAEVALGGGMTVTRARATVPLGWGVEAPSGTLSIERIAGLTLAIDDIGSTTRFADGHLLLPDLRYVHYGGRGGGWVEVAVDGRVMPFRTRLEGGGVDLERVTATWGANVARVTGKLHYVATAVYTTPQGFLGGVQVDSEEGGGEIAIDAIRRLLDSSRAQVDATGMLRNTLESLRVFRYESLEGDLWLGQETDRVNLSLRGRKRLGIFPAPVDAINFRNVPLSVLTRTLRKGETQ